MLVYSRSLVGIGDSLASRSLAKPEFRGEPTAVKLHQIEGCVVRVLIRQVAHLVISFRSHVALVSSIELAHVYLSSLCVKSR